MSPQQREIRKREIEAEKIPEEQILEMVEKINDEKYLVQSFTLEDIVYEITVSDIEICACNCTDFSFFKSPCKHMFLLLRSNPTFVIARNQSYGSEIVELNDSSEITR